MPTMNQLSKKARIHKYRRARLLALEGSPHRRGVIYKIATMTPRKPNSAKRKIAKVRLIYNKNVYLLIYLEWAIIYMSIRMLCYEVVAQKICPELTML